MDTAWCNPANSPNFACRKEEIIVIFMVLGLRFIHAFFLGKLFDNV